MIHRIYSDLPSFKQLEFGPGLNILVSDRTETSTQRQTRNGAGKSSLLHIIHFLMGAKRDDQGPFKSEQLRDASFGMRLDVGGMTLDVSRRPAQSPLVVLAESVQWAPPRGLDAERTTEGWQMRNQDWGSYLGEAVFGLPQQPEKHAPTFRMLFPYFARRQSDGGFSFPEKAVATHRPWQWQVALSYLLGLDWRLAQAWQKVRDRESRLNALRVEYGLRDDTPGGAAARIRSDLAIASEDAERLRQALATFRVVPEYSELEEEAAQLSRQIGDLADADTLDHELLLSLRQSMLEERRPSLPDIAEAYGQVGIQLPDLVRRRMDEVQEFHESITRNRQEYLRSEEEACAARIAERQAQIERIDARRAEVLSVLQASGALEQFAALQRESVRVETEAETLKQRLELAEQLASDGARMKIDRKDLSLRLQRDVHEREQIVHRAIVAFEDVSRRLLEDQGRLVLIDDDDNGIQFKVEIRARRSHGISRMQIFCFDMMLMQVQIEHGRGPGFLVHDSHLFDGVDERQVATALAVGAETAERLGFQYIVTMNSDKMPRSSDLPPGFSLDSYMLPVRLTDATEDGGLFGFRFG